MIHTATHLLDPVPDPRAPRPASSVWDSATGTVLETSRKLPHSALQG